MTRHPGGKENTLKLFAAAGLSEESYVLDMGAGDGESGCSVCIDLNPGSGSVIRGDFLNLPFEDETFDGVLSECSFFISGDYKKAVSEACRVLKPGGKLMLGDVFFSEPELPWFRIEYIEDITSQWREYYIEALWRDEICCEFEHIPHGHPKYYLIAAEKEK